MEVDNIIKYYIQIAKLKKLIRKGWQLKNIPNPESVADHTFGVATLAFMIGKKLNLDVEKMVIMALIHEAAETIYGDITPHDGTSEDEKYKMEEHGSKEILSLISPNGELFDLWKDFELKRTVEGKIVKELDRLEMALQAFQYENDTNVPLDDFFEYVESRIETQELKNILNTILAIRQENS
jgi:putative hydrolases of HD superfamily